MLSTVHPEWPTKASRVTLGQLEWGPGTSAVHTPCSVSPIVQLRTVINVPLNPCPLKWETGNMAVNLRAAILLGGPRSNQQVFTLRGNTIMLRRVGTSCIKRRPWSSLYSYWRDPFIEQLLIEYPLCVLNGVREECNAKAKCLAIYVYTEIIHIIINLRGADRKQSKCPQSWRRNIEISTFTKD